MTTESYELILVPLTDSVPASARLKRALKSLLRTYRFRCSSVKVGNSNSGGIQVRKDEAEEILEEAQGVMEDL